jgi:hypothetical protein
VNDNTSLIDAELLDAEFVDTEFVDTDSSGLAGLQVQFDIALKFTSPLTHMAPMSKALAASFDAAPQIPVHLVGLSQDHRYVSMTFAITLGSLDEIKNSQPRTLLALNLISQLVSQLSSYGPVLTALPAKDSHDSRAAVAFLAREQNTGRAVSQSLIAIG